MIRITKEKAIELHNFICDMTGGDSGIREIGLLESALEAPFATFGGEDLYPTLEQKAARLCHSLISNHAFVDGNKRIGMFLLLIFLRVNGVSLDISTDDVARLGFALAAGEMSYDELVDYITKAVII